MPTKKKKKYNARFPPARIKKIMQTDEDVGKVAAAVPVIISKALEMFVETLLKDVDTTLTNRGARTMTPGHLKMCIQSEPRFDFLKDLVADVPDLQGDFDDANATSGAPARAAHSSSEATASPPRDGSCVPGQLTRSVSTASSSSQGSQSTTRRTSTGRPRGRPRKGSSDTNQGAVNQSSTSSNRNGRASQRTEAAKPKYVEVDEDDDSDDLLPASEDESNGRDHEDDLPPPAKRPHVTPGAAIPPISVLNGNGAVPFTISLAQPAASLGLGAAATALAPVTHGLKNGCLDLSNNAKNSPTMTSSTSVSLDEDYDA